MFLLKAWQFNGFLPHAKHTIAKTQTINGMFEIAKGRSFRFPGQTGKVAVDFLLRDILRQFVELQADMGQFAPVIA